MYQFNDNHCDNKYNINSEKFRFSKITAADGFITVMKKMTVNSVKYRLSEPKSSQNWNCAVI